MLREPHFTNGCRRAAFPTTDLAGSSRFTLTIWRSSSPLLAQREPGNRMAALRRTDRGNEWWVDFRYRRKRIRKRSPVQSKRGAEQYERQLRQEFADDETHGKNPFADPPKFEEFAGEWFERYVKVRSRICWQSETRRSLNRHLIPEFGHLRLDGITTEYIDAFVARKTSAGLRPKTINNFLTILRCSLVVAHEWGYVSQVPRVRWLRVPEQPYECITPDEVERLLRACEPGFWKTLTTFIADTGVRFGEASALAWQDVDFDGTEPQARICRGASLGTIGTTKTGRIRFVPLSERICSLLRNQPRTCSLVFPRSDRDNSRALLATNTVRHLHRACDRAGIRRIGWHALRHSLATTLCQRGMPLRDVQALLGHSTILMTSRYAHASDHDVRQWIRRCWNPDSNEDGHQEDTKPNSES